MGTLIPHFLQPLNVDRGVPSPTKNDYKRKETLNNAVLTRFPRMPEISALCIRDIEFLRDYMHDQ